METQQAKVSARSGSWKALVRGHPRIATVRLQTQSFFLKYISPMLSTVQTTLPVDSQTLLLIRGVLLPFPPKVNSLFFNCNFEYNGLFLAMSLSISSNM